MIPFRTLSTSNTLSESFKYSCTHSSTDYNQLPEKAVTIRRRPSMRAIKPPVLVPPMRSKYSQGSASCADPADLPISAMISFKINSEDNPLTPPPSSDKTRGQCSIVDVPQKVWAAKSVTTCLLVL